MYLFSLCHSHALPLCTLHAVFTVSFVWFVWSQIAICPKCFLVCNLLKPLLKGMVHLENKNSVIIISALHNKNKNKNKSKTKTPKTE